MGRSERQQSPEHIRPVHFEEWVKGSAVDPKIAALNVKSLDEPREIDKLLNRNTTQRWKHWEHGEGWAVTGLNPMTDEETYEGCQFKPDKPVQRVENGKPKFKRNGDPDLQKYFSASGYETAPLFLNTGEPGYWQKIKADVAKRVLVAEGAKKAGSALTTGEACISLPGVTNGQRKGRLKKSLQEYCTIGREIILGFDSDQYHNMNVCKAIDKLGKLIAACGAVVKVLLLPRNTKGIDDFIVKYGAEAFHQLVSEALTLEEWREQFINRKYQPVEIDPNEPDPLVPLTEEVYTLRAQSALFTHNKWVSIDGHLYKWVGTHYERQFPSVVKQQISEWCRVTPVLVAGRWVFAYATATHVNNIYSWVVDSSAVDPALVNPPGLNCLNGVLKLHWQGYTPRWELVRHDPATVYTYVGQFEFDPKADPANCDRLLSCLEPEQRRIFLQTLAASLDLNTIRLFRGRGIKALLCKGEGNNGKDSLREAVQLLYGVGVVNTTVSDFFSYDQGRKFTLAKLEHARISWSSENSSFSQIDNLQSLKAAITGEALDLERKNVDERVMTPSTVFFFNINNTPNLQASLEAIQSRWAVLSFEKTFKENADPSKGELEADPRFRYDPNFLQKEVVPALLNKMLETLPEVATQSIDYSSTESALKEIQREANHLWEFCQDVGLDYCPGERVYMGELHQVLLDWYIDNGYLTITTNAKGDKKKDWVEPTRRGDKLVKVSKDVRQRFEELFPKAVKGKDNSRSGNTGNVYLSGIGFATEALLKSLPKSLPKSLLKSPSLTQWAAEAAEALSPTSSYILEKIEGLSVEERHLLIDLVNKWEKEVNSASAASAALPESISDYSSALGSDYSSASAENSPSTTTNSPNAYSSIGSATKASNSGSGDVILGNTTKNFADQLADRHQLKVGDKCKAKNPSAYGIPENTELTIREINKQVAAVTFDGCHSPFGQNIPLDQLWRSYPFKVGDKVEVKYGNLYGLPPGVEMTIKRIEGEEAIVTYPGCRSASGVPAHMSELRAIEQPVAETPEGE